jgi:hypothetical protein
MVAKQKKTNGKESRIKKRANKEPVKNFVKTEDIRFRIGFQGKLIIASHHCSQCLLSMVNFLI